MHAALPLGFAAMQHDAYVPDPIAAFKGNVASQHENDAPRQR
jgi:hypothetical protein